MAHRVNELAHSLDVVRRTRRFQTSTLSTSTNSLVSKARLFDVNQKAVQKFIPWVPEKDRVSARRSRLFDEWKKKSIARVEELSSFNSRLSSSERDSLEKAPLPPTPHSDPMENHRNSMEFMRQTYRCEISALEKNPILPSNNILLETGVKVEPVALKQKNTFDQSNETSTVISSTASSTSQLRQSTHAALTLLQQIAGNEVRLEKDRNRRIQTSYDNQKQLLELHNDSKTFIQPHLLDEAIDACLETRSRASFNLKAMETAEHEWLKTTREKKLMACVAEDDVEEARRMRRAETTMLMLETSSP